jgi:trigger factor
VKIDKQIQEDHQARLIVEVEPKRMEAVMHRAARKLSERGKIPGFRPGKAPYDVVRRYYGDETVQEQALDMLVDDVYPEVLKEAKIEPAAAGSLEKVDSLEPPKLTFLIPLAPEVDLGDYRSIRLPYEWKEPGPDKLDEALQELRRMYATTQTVERPVQEGDFVMADVMGELKDAEEGVDQSAIQRQGAALYVDKEDKDKEWPYPGFARQLIGLKTGESQSLSHKYPKDYEDESLQGQTARFEVTVQAVRGVTLPDLDDEFAKTVGDFEDLEKLREAVKKDLEGRSKTEYDDRYYINLLDKIKEGATIKFPPQVLDHESEHVLDDLRGRLASQNLDLETYLKMHQTDKAKFMEEEIKPVAVRRLERSLILDELAKAEKVEVDEKSLNQEFSETMSQLQYQSNVDFKKVASGGQRSQQQFAEAVAMESANRLIVRRTLEHLKAIATGEARGKATEKTSAKRSTKSVKAEGAPKSKKSASANKATGSASSKPKSTRKAASKQTAENKEK